MKKYFSVIALISISLLLASKVNATQAFISDVPAYNWYHGCGPTAAASIIGYYDLHGYNNLFNANGWDAVSVTSNVQDEISSPEHNSKYDPHPDKASLPVPPDTSIADFFHTSENQPFGWSWQSDAPNAFKDYAAYRGYKDWSAWNDDNFTFDELKFEINNDYLLMFLVDTDGNGSTDHFVPVFGYDDVTMQYACYTTWSELETIAWYTFQDMHKGAMWGVGNATIIRPGTPNSPVPVPASMLLLGTGIAGFVGNRLCKRKKN